MRITSTFLLKIATGGLLLFPPFVVLFAVLTAPFFFFPGRIYDLQEPTSMVVVIKLGFHLLMVLYFLGIFLFAKLQKTWEIDDHELHLLYVLTFIILPVLLVSFLFFFSIPV